MFLFFDDDACIEQKSSQWEFTHKGVVGSLNSQQELTSAKILDII